MPENEEYFYHPDHLGSTSYITDHNGGVVQFASYLPYGEALADEHTVSVAQTYKFNGKELDEETGLCYYGIRYYHPKYGLWYGVDPFAEKYNSIGGYVYCFDNPVRFKDPDGQEPITAIVDAITAFAVEAGMSFVENVVLNDMSPKVAFDNIKWGNAAVEGVKSYGVSLIFTGAGSAKALKRVAESKIGKMGIDFFGNVIGDLMKKYRNGDFNDGNGNFSFDKLKDANFEKIMSEALVETLVSFGCSKKADEIKNKFLKAQADVAKQESKLLKSIQRGASHKTIANRAKKVDLAQKKMLKLLGGAATVNLINGASAKGLNKGIDEISK